MATSTSRRSDGSPEEPEPKGRAWPWLTVLLVAIVALLFWATRSPLFRMRDLDVSGTAHLSKEHIAALGHLDGQTNVFWIDLDWVETRLESDPWIEDAVVSRTLPGTVHVQIVERTAVATVRAGVSGWWLVAGDGFVLEQAGTAPSGIPVIAPPKRAADLAIGASPGWLRGAAGAVAAIDPSLRPSVSTIRLSPHGDLVLRMGGGETVLFGPAEELPAKAAALAAVLDWSVSEAQPLATIDLRAPRAPAALTVKEVAREEPAEGATDAAPEGTSDGAAGEGTEATG